MMLRITPAVLARYKNIRVGAIYTENMTNAGQNQQVIELLQQQIARLQNAFNEKTIEAHPHLVIAKQYRMKQLVHGVEQIFATHMTPFYKNQTTLQLLCTFISLKYLLPVVAYDIQKRPNIISIDLEQQLVYRDEDTGIFKSIIDGAFLNITPNTQQALVTLIAFEGVEPIVLNTAVYELMRLIENYCGGIGASYLLDEHAPQVVLTEASTKQQESVSPHDMLLDVYAYSLVPAETSLEHKIRLEKVDKLEARGINPWPPVKMVTATTIQVLHAFEAGHTDENFSIAGRVMSIRLHGKTAFLHIQDREGQLQLYLKKDIVGAQLFAFFKEFIDIGDILWVTGCVFKTKVGEVSLEVSDFELQSKCLYPLPEKFHGLTDRETKYRQRYLDLMVNAEARTRFIKRSELISYLRQFLNKRDYTEVETPMLHPIAGGAAAKPFITHHNALDSDFYLRIAPELYLKRLVIAGFERVYEINRNFRNEGISTKHNPEFTMVEFYTAYQDYHYAMAMVEELFKELACILHDGETCLHYGNHIINFSQPFERISMTDAVIKYGKVSPQALDANAIDQTLQEKKITLEPGKRAYGYKLLALFEELVEKELIQPTFITGFPVEVSPLAKRDPQNKHIASRFELFVAGMELSNGFNELNDPFDQANRFYDQLKNRETGDLEAHEFDADYIRAMEYGLPPTVGVGIGIDRLTMLMTNTQTIREVILFPTLKKK